MQSNLYQEIAQKMEAAADVLLPRLLAEPHNITTIINMVDPAMFAGQHPAFLAILNEYQSRGRYDPYTIGAKVGDIPGMLEKATRHAETSLDSAFEIYQHTHSQFCALNLHNVAERGVLDGKDAGEICGDMERELKAKGAIRKSAMSDGYDTFSSEIMDKLDGKVIDYPVKPFLKSFREYTPFYWDTDFILIAGRPGMGKSMAAIQECLHNAMNGVPTVYINLEIRPSMVWWRVFSVLCGFGIRDDFKKMNDVELLRVHEALRTIESLKKTNMLQVSMPGNSLTDVMTDMQTRHMMHGAHFFVIDYVQLIRINGMNELRAIVTEVSAKLRAFAMRTSTVVCGVCQLSRASENSANKRPGLLHLKESGSLEQDAVMVTMVHRPEYYNIQTDEDGEPYPDRYAEFMIVKNRNDKLAIIKCRFDGLLGFHDAPPPTPPDFDPEPFNPKPSFSNQPLPRPNLDADVPF